MLAELLVRQISLLAVLAALGSGPATVLPARVPAIARIAIAPVLGLVLAAPLLVDTSALMPMSAGAWAVLVPLAAVSLLLAASRLRRAAVSSRPARRELALLAVTVVVVVGAVDAPLVAKGSLGPMGYTISDAIYLTGQHEALQEHALSGLGPRGSRGANRLLYRSLKPGNPILALSKPQRREATDDIRRMFEAIPAGFPSLAAATDELFGWHAVDTQSGFLGVLVLLCALGAFALAVLLTGSAWAALFAGLLLAGPVAFQTFIESGEASLAAMTAIAPIALVGILIARAGARWPLIGLLGWLFAGLSALYGLWLPALGLSAALVAGGLALRASRRGDLSRDAWLRGIAMLAAVGVLAVGISPVAFARTVRFWHLLGSTDLIHFLLVIGTPSYHLSVDAVPSWLLQTRDLYSLGPATAGGLRGVGRGLLLPLLLIALIAYGAWHYRGRGGLLLLAPVPVVALLAFYVSASKDCSYCVQRQLLLLEPNAAVLLAAGLAALPGALAGLRLLRDRPSWSPALPWVAAALGVAILALTAQRTVNLARRVVGGGYALDGGARTLAWRLDGDRQPVLIEAGGATPGSVMELPLTYYAVDEASATRPAVYRGTEDFLAISRFSSSPFVDIGPRPGYGLVLTRARGIEDGRSTIATSGPYALQRRARPFDVSPVSGFATEEASRDTSGTAWLTGPLRLAVAAGTSAPAWVRVRLAGPAAGTLRAGAGVKQGRPGGGAVELCARVPGRGALRSLLVPLQFHNLPEQPPPQAYGSVQVPGHGLRVVALSASSRPC